MPRVGNRSFPYTRAGQQQAKRYARETGQPVNESGNYGTRGGNTQYNRSPYPTRPTRQDSIRRPGPGMPPPPGGMRGGINPRARRPLVGPGTGIGGGPRPLPRRGNAIQNPASRLQGPGGRGGSRVMRNPGLGGGKIGGGNVPTPGFQRKKTRSGGGY